MYIPLLFNTVACSMVCKDTSPHKSPKLPDQTGLLNNYISIELPFIQFHLTLLNSPYGCESAGGKTPDTGQPATAKFLHLWSIELCVTWVCVCMCVCEDTGILAYYNQDAGALKECVITVRAGPDQVGWVKCLVHLRPLCSVTPGPWRGSCSPSDHIYSFPVLSNLHSGNTNAGMIPIVPVQGHCFPYRAHTRCTTKHMDIRTWVLDEMKIIPAVYFWLLMLLQTLINPFI